jgi:pimeloyl-ACP methyl ester carboxylesterase
MLRATFLLVAAAALAGAAAASADATRWPAWLCRPGLKIDYCNTDPSTTVIRPDGSSSIERIADTRAPVDCFYVYPTVSQEHGGNADLRIQTPEKAAVVAQAARFAQVCRVFAPVYRQTTAYGGGSPDVAYESVLSAWRDYLAHWNHGRGVVLIGHSQGASVLERLIGDETRSVRKHLVSALLLGGSVPVGADDRFAGFPRAARRRRPGASSATRAGAARRRRTPGSSTCRCRPSMSSA